MQKLLGRPYTQESLTEKPHGRMSEPLCNPSAVGDSRRMLAFALKFHEADSAEDDEKGDFFANNHETTMVPLT